MSKLILGSSSPWRAKVLRDAGIPFEQMSPDIDEKAIRNDDPDFLTMLIALAKSEALRPRLTPGDILVTCDQVAVVDGVIREKPVDADEARAWLRGYRSSSVMTVSAVCLSWHGTLTQFHGADRAVVSFGDISDEAIERAIARGDVLGSCGAFTVDDPDIAPYVLRIDGYKSSVDGLPLALLLKFLGFADPHFFRRS